MISSADTSCLVEIRQYAGDDHDAWQGYVRTCPSATVFHLLQWSRAVEQAYGHRPCHLTAWQRGRLVGVLPLFLVRSVFAGRILVSVPYATYGGILADRPQVAAGLLESAKELCRSFGAGYLELRHRDPSGLDLPETGHYDTFRKPLPERPQDVLPALPRKTRAAVRKGLLELGDDSAVFSADLLDAIYDLYAHTLRRLGSPNYRRDLFRALQTEYGQDCVCLGMRQDGRYVAGVVSFVFRDEIVPYFSGSLPEGQAARANNVMYLRLMEYAVRRKLRLFDFNRSRRDNSGPYNFKRHYGFEPASLHYQVFLNKADRLPNLSPSNGRYALAGKVWRRMPLWFTRTVGQRITKWIP
jgi:FemAB-related protein (PEP-CTERM system-associated)